MGLELHTAVTQTHPHERVSGKYCFVPSTEVLGVLDEAGWYPASQQIASVRKEEYQGFQALHNKDMN